MKISDFSRISDSNDKLGSRRAKVDEQRASKKISDAKAALSQKIRDTESDQELIDVVVESAAELPVSDVIGAVVEVLSPIVEKLNNELADARRAVATIRKRSKDSSQASKPKMDSVSKKRFISRMKDDETTLEDLKEEAVDLLATFDPASVIEVFIDALPPVIEAVQAASSNE